MYFDKCLRYCVISYVMQMASLIYRGLSKMADIFADDILTCIFFNENYSILGYISSPTLKRKCCHLSPSSNYQKIWPHYMCPLFTHDIPWLPLPTRGACPMYCIFLTCTLCRFHCHDFSWPLKLPEGLTLLYVRTMNRFQVSLPQCTIMAPPITRRSGLTTCS